jgi:HPt (histidine-containing phosphotransfer) domain-containing protein
MSGWGSLDALRDRFLAGLPARADALQRTLDAAPGNVDAAYDAMVLLHSLAGVAGMYGLDEITAAARRGEMLCDGAVRVQRPLSGAELSEVRSIVAGLRGREAAAA